MKSMIPYEQFEKLVVEVLDNLPPQFQARMSNVELLIEDWPSQELLKSMGMAPGDTLLGLYEGIPLTERTHDYGLVTPDIITLFQGPIEAEAGGDLEAIRKEVRHTVLHELAHHFGIDDDRLWELGKY